MNRLTNQRGVALMAVLMAVTILGLMSGIAGSSWKTIVQRGKEQELLWRGNQYRLAIESYYQTTHGGAKGVLPSSLENLIRDPRSVGTIRHLRKLYLDPLTEEDWTLIKDPAGRIMGVKSSSMLQPFKQDNFREENQDFSGKTAYSEWQFIYDIKSSKKQAQKPAETAPQPKTDSPFVESPVSAK